MTIQKQNKRIVLKQPMGKNNLIVKKKIWLPKGKWIELYSGTMLEGGKVIQRAFDLDEIPVYVKEGSIIPMQANVKGLGKKPLNPMVLNIFLGETGNTKVYDDEGNNNNYKTGVYTFTNMKVVIKPVKGKYPGMLKSRAYELRLPVCFPCKSVKINGKIIPYKRDASANSWTYNGNEFTIHIFTSEFSVFQKVEVKIKFPKYDSKLLYKKRQKIKRLIKFMKFLAKNKWDKSKYSNDIVVHAAQTGHRITLNPKNAFSEIQEFDKEWKQVLEMIKACSLKNIKYAPYLELLKITDQDN